MFLVKRRIVGGMASLVGTSLRSVFLEMFLERFIFYKVVLLRLTTIFIILNLFLRKTRLFGLLLAIFIVLG
jgi:hypothetical protein